MSGANNDSATMPCGLTLDAAIRFVWAEADMLDRLDYRPWLDLWSRDGLYIVPIEREITDHADALNIAYDDEAMRAARVKRLKSGFAMSSHPPARTVRSLSRFVVTSDGLDKLTLRAAMIVVEYKYERTRLIGANVDYALTLQGEGIRLAGKTVRLLNSDDYLHGLGYLL